MDRLLQDLRYAFRQLRRSPGFTAAAIVILALGIGVNTAVFSVVNMMFLRPLPFEEPDRVLRLYGVQGRSGWEEGGFSAADLADIHAGTSALAEVAAVGAGGFNLGGGEEPVRASGAQITANLFPLLGIQPLLGRNFLPEENEPGAERVVILSDGLWQQQFGGARDVIGRVVSVNGAPASVVGVMPPGFGFPERAQLWLPARPDPSEPRSARRYLAVARLAPGATLEQANTELARVSRELAAEHPATNADLAFGARRYQEAYTRGERATMLYLLLAAVGFVLLIACANVANLLLARGTSRQREIAVRTAIGAGRGRIVRQLLTESLMLALAGGALGVAVAMGWLRWLVSRLDIELVYWMSFEIDWRVLLYALGLSLLTGLAFGTLPALRTSRPDLTHALKEGGHGRSSGPRRSRAHGALVVGEIALSLILLVGATLAIRSFLASVTTDPGLASERILTLRTSLTGERYDATAARAESFLELAERIRALPGVEGAAFTTALPAGDLGMGVRIEAEGQPAAEGEALPVRLVSITPGYWQALGQPLLAGRTFTAQEAADSASAVAIVSSELAERLWPGENPLGRRLRQVQAQGEPGAWLTVVGVAPTLPYARPGDTGAPWAQQLHTPYAASGWRLMTLAVRTSADPMALAPLIRREVRVLDPTLPVFDLRTLDEYRASTIWDRRAFGETFGSFALLALALAAIGVYGVVAYTVGHRTREIGIRKALGAQDTEVATMVLREGLVLASLGIAIGLLGAFALAQLMRGMLPGIAALDPVAFGGIPLLLGGVTVLASYLPARRATRVDPIIALRAE